MYSLGKGVPQDYVEAHKWWNLAAAQGNKPAETDRGIVARKMTPAQIAEAQRLASRVALIVSIEKKAMGMIDPTDFVFEVQESKRWIIVTLPPTRFIQTFTVPKQNGVFASLDWVRDDPGADITIKEFSRDAEAAARSKARELDWIK